MPTSSLEWRRRFEYLQQRVSLDTWDLVANKYGGDPWYDVTIAMITKEAKGRKYSLFILKHPYNPHEAHSTYTALKTAQAMGIALVRM